MFDCLTTSAIHRAVSLQLNVPLYAINITNIEVSKLNASNLYVYFENLLTTYDTVTVLNESHLVSNPFIYLKKGKFAIVSSDILARFKYLDARFVYLEPANDVYASAVKKLLEFSYMGEWDIAKIIYPKYFEQLDCDKYTSFDIPINLDNHTPQQDLYIEICCAFNSVISPKQELGVYARLLELAGYMAKYNNTELKFYKEFKDDWYNFESQSREFLCRTFAKLLKAQTSLNH